MCVNLVSKMPHTCASFTLRWRKGLSQGFVHQFPFDLEAGLVCCVWANPGDGTWQCAFCAFLAGTSGMGWFETWAIACAILCCCGGGALDRKIRESASSAEEIWKEMKGPRRNKEKFIEMKTNEGLPVGSMDHVLPWILCFSFLPENRLMAQVTSTGLGHWKTWWEIESNQATDRSLCMWDYTQGLMELLGIGHPLPSCATACYQLWDSRFLRYDPTASLRCSCAFFRSVSLPCRFHEESVWPTFHSTIGCSWKDTTSIIWDHHSPFHDHLWKATDSRNFLPFLFFCFSAHVVRHLLWRFWRPDSGDDQD